MSYICPLCQDKIEGDLLAFKEHTENHIVDEVKLRHPDWIKENGLCPKCLAYYRNQINGKQEVVKNKSTGILAKLKNLFK